jgi:hypothetical protein
MELNIRDPPQTVTDDQNPKLVMQTRQNKEDEARSKAILIVYIYLDVHHMHQSNHRFVNQITDLSIKSNISIENS